MERYSHVFSQVIPLSIEDLEERHLVDLIYYVDEAIIKYQPSQVFIYCGENDMADVDTVSPATVLDRFKTLHAILLKKLPRTTKIVFVSLKPSVARWHLESKFIEANKLIEGYINYTKKYSISRCAHCYVR